ncbi:MAG: hypothetical protein F6J94_15535 [Moorea sp. SIO1F2]|uniref:hypothetical protein n=1 Tax=unclassified Moorena TaxID=2683338 RepID=UPI0013BD0D13|nr:MULTISPECIES: hypothetical protein [unclassified Moorena]NEP26475.1 hypothetical protein [Moorena sp. SIO3I6]NET83274.1 hypothetical protein [Moorena sp. SIO1F2]
MGIGGHCLFNCSPFNKDHFQQCPPYNYPDSYHQTVRPWVLVGIAYLIARRSMPDLSEAMPSLQVSRFSRLPIPDSNWVLVGIAYLIARRSMPDLSEAMPTLQVFKFLILNSQFLILHS